MRLVELMEETVFVIYMFFFFQAEDGIRDLTVTGVQTCALPISPLVGRETELGFLTKRWENAMEGEGQAVLLQGEAGIGKSRLLQTLRMQLRETPHTELVFYGSPQHQTSPLWPVIQQWNRALGLAGEKDDVARRERLRHFLGDRD